MKYKILIPNTNLEIECNAYRRGDEVWLSSANTTFRLPINPEKDPPPPEQFGVRGNRDFESWHAELQSLACSNEGIAVTIAKDTTARTATINGKHPLNFEGFHAVTTMWKNFSLEWKIVHDHVLALYEGKVVAHVDLEEGYTLVQMGVYRIDSDFWAAARQFAFVSDPNMMLEGVAEQAASDGKVVEELRRFMATPMSAEVTCSGPTDGYMQIGPARVRLSHFKAVSVGVMHLKEKLKKDITWHATSHLSPVIARVDGRVVGIISPTFSMQKGGDA